MQGLSGFDLPPSEKFFKSNLSKHLTYLQKGAELFHLSEPFAFTASFRENGQAVAELSKPCPL